MLWALLLAGLASRIYASWALRHNLNLDAGVVTLMARHIALGKDFPVFFYGQPHMGCLEAWCSAFFCRIMGISGFAVCLGTAFVAIWILPIAYLWAKEAAGKRAGYMAIVLLIIGPGGFFHYNASPRGAYASALTLGAFVLWYATRMAIRWAQTHTQSGWDFLLLGLGAGLAWWSNQITTAAILGAGLLLLSVMRLHAITWRLLAGMIGFLVGSAPFWYYNITNDWASLSFGGTFGRVPFRRALVWLYTDRFPSLLFPTNQPAALRGVAAALLLLLLAYGLFQLCKKRPSTGLQLTIRGIFLFVIIFSAIFASSHFSAIETPRYTLPLVAPLAVLLALAANCFARHFHPVSAWIPLLYIVSMQLYYSVQWAHQFERREAAQYRRLQTLGQELETHGHTKLYAPLSRRAWTFALDERIIFCELRHNMYRPHEQLLEWQDDATFLDNHGDPARFVRDAGGMLQTAQFGRHSIYQTTYPPARYEAEILPEGWQRAVTSQGQDVLTVLTDNTLHTLAECPPLSGAHNLLVTFKEPQTIQTIRFTAPRPEHLPSQLQVEGKTPDGDWIVLRDAANLTLLFWSGPRPYFGGPLHRVELRVPPQPLQAIRFTNQQENDRNRWILQSLQFFKPATTASHHNQEIGSAASAHTMKTAEENDEQYARQLRTWLQQQDITNLYADRWLANTIYRKTDGAIKTPLDPVIFPRHPALPIDNMSFTDQTAIAIRHKDAFNLRRALEGRLVVDDGTTVGPWVVFRPVPPLPRQPVGLRWHGWTAMRDDAARAAALAQRAQEDVPPHAAIKKLKEAVNLNPTMYHERIRLRDLLLEQDQNEAAAIIEQEIRARSAPEDAFPPIHFDNGVTLSGLEIAHMKDKTLKLTYYWQAPAEMQHERFAVFVHFVQDGNVVAQDDHIFLSDIPAALLAHHQQDLHLAITRHIATPPGNPRMMIGLYDRVSGERIRNRTELPTRYRAATLPLDLGQP